MIPEHLVANIIDMAQIEEVVSDFITLKKRGANYIANCPFHNEKTPSFSVSPSKGIYKCFGCGKAGNSVGFVMEHESMSYPEALRYVANKYNIEVEEINNEQGKEQRQERDSLFIVNQFAQKHFDNNLFNTDEGRSIGLSYFKERGFREETIRKFELGYSMDSFDALINDAKAKGYKFELLQKLGLAKEKDGRTYDFFRGRVQFTIHNLSGKVVAFAGRILKTNKKAPKYVNSPETEVYFKSKVLYGMNFAKKSIRENDECYLVEGYTDVISLHQAGIENVVASSGTSLTEDQIRLVKRYTPNITFLFDGDAAGVKAALRGVDMVLEQGLNVKIVQLPPDQDPDSFIQAKGRTGFEEYIKETGKDFIFFKTSLLLADVANDPIKRSGVIKDIIQTLAKIPDPIKRSLYVRECSKLLEVKEEIIINETNRLKWSKIKKEQQDYERAQLRQERPPKTTTSATTNTTTTKDVFSENFPIDGTSPEDAIKTKTNTVSESELMRVLLEYGDKEIEIGLPVAAYIVNEIEEIPFTNKNYKEIYDIFYKQLEKGRVPNSDYFVSHTNKTINNTAIQLIAVAYQVSSNWAKMHEIYINEMVQQFKLEVTELVQRYQLQYVKKMILENQEQMKKAQVEKNVEAQMECLENAQMLLDWRMKLAKTLKMDILH